MIEKYKSPYTAALTGGGFLFEETIMLLPLLQDENSEKLLQEEKVNNNVFQELSPYGVLVSGGDVTSARLFVKIQGNKEILGLVGYWDVVAWDEFEQQKGRNVDAVLIDTMQNYLANKSFNRGKGTHEASASMSFVGNTKHTVPYMLKNSHLFESIPTAFIKGAFLDRMHLYNPGWEIKVLKKDSFSKGYGLITDYIAAVLHALRNDDRTALLKDYAKFDGSLSERDHLAIRKTFSGMMKLIYPDGNMTDEEAKELIDFAAEGRKRVKDQLYIIDSTFCAEPAKFQYTWLKSGETVTVETLENIEHKHTNTEETDEEDEVKQETKTPGSRPRIKSLVAKTISIRENQGGVTYKDLFGDYYLSTQNDDEEKVAEGIDSFNDLADELLPIGIEFTYDFKADHDRLIRTDTGWTITLGRGLDIYEKFGRFSLSRSNQKARRCKAFNVAINKTEE